MIEKYAKCFPGNTGNIILDMGVTSGFIAGAKAMQSGEIVRWAKENEVTK